jgi:hypothetical protein
MSDCIFAKCKHDHFWMRSDEFPSIFDETYETDGIICPFCKKYSVSSQRVPHDMILNEIIYRIDESLTEGQLVIKLMLECDVRVSDLYLRGI